MELADFLANSILVALTEVRQLLPATMEIKTLVESDLNREKVSCRLIENAKLQKNDKTTGDRAAAVHPGCAVGSKTN